MNLRDFKKYVKCERKLLEEIFLVSCHVLASKSLPLSYFGTVVWLEEQQQWHHLGAC